jgi:hypothetical protein
LSKTPSPVFPKGLANKPEGTNIGGFMPFCSKCGTQNPDTASTCSSCGNSLTPKKDIFNSSPSGGGLFDGIKSYIEKLMLFFDSGEFFQTSWRAFFYHLSAAFYALLPIAAIAVAIKFNIFDAPGKIIAVLFIVFIFLTVASILSFFAIRSRTKDFDEATKGFSTCKVNLANFYDFFKVAYVHSVETNVYASSIFTAIVIFGLAFCSLFAEEIRSILGNYILLGFIVGPLIAYANIFITKIIVLFLKVFLEYLPKLFIMPIRALYNLFGIIIDTRQNLWK